MTPVLFLHVSLNISILLYADYLCMCTKYLLQLLHFKICQNGECLPNVGVFSCNRNYYVFKEERWADRPS